MKRPILLASLALFGCHTVGPNPQEVLSEGLPSPPSTQPTTISNASMEQQMNPNKIAAPVTADQLYQPFLVSYKTAAWDDYLISSGQARSGKAYYDTVPFPPDKDYSPFDYATCPDPKSAPKSNVGYGPPGSLAVNVSQIPGVCNPKPPAANPAPAPQAQPAAAKLRPSSTTASTAPPQTPTVNPGQEIPGSSYQSIHARQMALNGVHLADLYCHQFFVAQKRRISRRTHRVQYNGRRRMLHNHQRWRHSDELPRSSARQAGLPITPPPQHRP